LAFRVVTLAILVGIFFVNDLLYLWEFSFSIGWTPFLIATVVLFSVFVYIKGKALKTLVTISEGNAIAGGVLLLLALIVYVLGSYIENLGFLRFFALILLVEACLFLGFDRRIPKVLFAPMVTLFLVLTLPFLNEIFKLEVTSYLLTIYFVGAASLTLLAVIIDRQILILRKLRRETSESCPLCGSHKLEGESFCSWCGKQIANPKPRAIKKFTLLFLLIYLIAGILLVARIPVLHIDEAQTFVYTIHGIEKQPLIRTPQGWVLLSSTRLID